MENRKIFLVFVPYTIISCDDGKKIVSNSINTCINDRKLRRNLSVIQTVDVKFFNDYLHKPIKKPHRPVTKKVHNQIFCEAQPKSERDQGVKPVGFADSKNTVIIRPLEPSKATGLQEPEALVPLLETGC